MVTFFSTAIICAIASAIMMGSVYLIDMAMTSTTYTRASQPMLISSVASFLPAPILFLMHWEAPPFEAAVVALGGGVILMCANWLYFLVLYSDSGESTEIACYENSSVLVIVLVTSVLSSMGVYHESLTWTQYSGIGIGALGLILLAIWGNQMDWVNWKHRKMLIGFMVLAGLYEMTVDYAMHLALQSSSITTPLQAYLSVSPFFWIGLSTGVVAVFPKEEMCELRKNWTNILASWKWILAAEACALVAFATMVYSFTTEHVAVTALVSGSFPIVVFVGGIIFRRQYGFSADTFPVVEHPLKKTIAVLINMTGAAFAGAKRTR